MAVLWGVLLGLSRLAADSEIIAMRASGLGIWYFVRVASIVAVAGTLLGLVNSLYLAPRANQAIIEMEQALETSQASYEIEPRVFYENFKELRSLRAGCARGRGRGQLAPGFHGRRQRSGESSDHHGSIGHRGERQLAGADHAPARRLARRDRGRRAGAVEYLDVHDHGHAAGAGPAERRAPGAHGYGALRDAAGRVVRAHSRAEWKAWGQALPDRAAQPLRASVGVPGADAAGRAAGRGFAARRQKRRLRFHHSAGVRVLLPLVDRHCSWGIRAICRRSSPYGLRILFLPRPASFCCGRWRPADGF